MSMLDTPNPIERIKMIKAMEYICRCLNDEEQFYEWLLVGVADGDIEYGDLSIGNDDIANLDYYIEDDEFADLMHTFLQLMAEALKDGGIYCNGILSKEMNSDDR